MLSGEQFDLTTILWLKRLVEVFAIQVRVLDVGEDVPQLEAEGTIPEAYTLEVSSPGLTRELKTVLDFQEKVGKEIKVKYVNAEDNLMSAIGRLESVNDDELILKFKKGAQNIKLNSIKNAKMEVTI